MIEALNRNCYCITLDTSALQAAIEREAPGLAALVAERCPYLFSAFPVFVSRPQIEAMREIVAAVEQVTALPAYREAVLARSAAIARFDPGARGVFLGYDFHLSADGPKLIEVNTNAGGALLNVLLARAQRACCSEVDGFVSGALPLEEIERSFFDMFLSEWRLAGRTGRPVRAAIVDERPEEQFLYPEFVLFERLFRRFGVAAVVLDPSQLEFSGGVLRDRQGPLDLVYNRLTDFTLEAPRHAALRDAYLSSASVVTPHPRAHALYADKTNLSLLTDAERLRQWGVGEPVIERLLGGIPRTVVVERKNAEALWGERRHLFFKPARGFGSKAAYRGEKLTRRVWEEILAGSYVAQELVRPSERHIASEESLKLDIRNYAYAGDIQLLAARLYQGQTTNLRTPGGGFAPVLTTAAAGEGSGGEADPGELSALARRSATPRNCY